MSLQEFNLVGFAQLFEETNGLCLAHLLTDKGQAGLGDFRHFVFDLFEVFWRKRFVPIKIVVKTVLDRGADSHLNPIAENFFHG